MWTYYVCILYLALYIYWFILQIIYDGVVFFTSTWWKPEARKIELLKVVQPTLAEPWFEFRQHASKVYVLSHCPLIYVKVFH